jgi:hypothetical protein
LEEGATSVVPSSDVQVFALPVLVVGGGEDVPVLGVFPEALKGWSKEAAAESSHLVFFGHRVVPQVVDMVISSF